MRYWRAFLTENNILKLININLLYPGYRPFVAMGLKEQRSQNNTGQSQWGTVFATVKKIQAFMSPVTVVMLSAPSTCTACRTLSDTVGHIQTQPEAVGLSQRQSGTVGHSRAQLDAVGRRQTQPES